MISMILAIFAVFRAICCAAVQKIFLQIISRGSKKNKLHEDCCSPDPHADAEVSEADEKHDDVDDEEEVLRALQPPVRALQLAPAHRAVTHPAARHSLGSLTELQKNL